MFGLIVSGKFEDRQTDDNVDGQAEYLVVLHDYMRRIPLISIQQMYSIYVSSLRLARKMCFSTVST